jgi:phosphate:Na+ symporter
VSLAGLAGKYSVLIGLGLIFLGIPNMKEGSEILKQGLDLAEYAMKGYLGVFVYILSGAVVTVVIQSSSATMAIIFTVTLWVKDQEIKELEDEYGYE